MRKCKYLIPASQLIILLCLLGSAPPAFAASIQATTTDLTQATTTQPRWYQPWGSFGSQENNQYSRSVINGYNNKDYQGHDQENSGNFGYNRGYNEDSSGNTGNQIISQGAIRPGRNNQYYEIFINNSSNSHFSGYMQGNSGNSGTNEGVNRDASGNLGNQILN